MHPNTNSHRRKTLSNHANIGRSESYQKIQKPSERQNNNLNNNQKNACNTTQNTQNSNVYFHNPSSQYNPYYLDPLQKQKKNRQTQFYNILDKCTQLPAQTKLLLRNYIKSQNQEVWHLFQRYKNININQCKKDKGSQNITHQARLQNSKEKLSFPDLQVALRKFIHKQKSKTAGDHDQNWKYYNQSLCKKSQNNSKDKNSERLNIMKKSIQKIPNKRQETSSKQKHALNKSKSRSSQKQLRKNSLNRNKIRFGAKSGEECSEQLNNLNRRFSERANIDKPAKTFRHTIVENQKQQQQKFLTARTSNRRNKVEIRKISMAIESAPTDSIILQRRDNIASSQINSPVKDPQYNLTTNHNNTEVESVCMGSSHLYPPSQDSQNFNLISTIKTTNSFNPGMTNQINFVKTECVQHDNNIKSRQQQKIISKKKLICIKIGTPNNSSKSKESSSIQKSAVDPFYLQKKIQQEIDFQLERQRFRCQSNEQSLLFRDISLRQEDQSQQSQILDGNTISFNKTPQALVNVQNRLKNSAKNIWSKSKGRYLGPQNYEFGDFANNRFYDVPNINLTITPTMNSKQQEKNHFKSHLGNLGNVWGRQSFKNREQQKMNGDARSDYKQNLCQDGSNNKKLKEQQQFRNFSELNTPQESTHRTFIEKRSINSLQEYNHKDIAPMLRYQYQQESDAHSSVSSYYPFQIINRNHQITNRKGQQCYRYYPYGQNILTKKENKQLTANDNCPYVLHAGYKNRQGRTQYQNEDFDINHCCYQASDCYADQKIKQLPLGLNFQFHQSNQQNFQGQTVHTQYPKKKKSITNNRYYRNLDVNRSLKSLGSYSYLNTKCQQNDNTSFLGKLQNIQNMSVQDFRQYHKQSQGRGGNNTHQNQSKIQKRQSGLPFMNIAQQSNIKIVQNQDIFDARKFEEENQISRRLFSSIFTQVQDLSHKKNGRKQSQNLKDGIKYLDNSNNNNSYKCSVFNKAEMIQSIRSSQNLQNTQNISYYNDLFQNRISDILTVPSNFRVEYQGSHTQECIPRIDGRNIRKHPKDTINSKVSGLDDIFSRHCSRVKNSQSQSLRRTIFSQSLEKLEGYPQSTAAVKFCKGLNKEKRYYQPGDFYKKIKRAIQS